MSDAQFDLETLSVLAARVDKRLKWAAFLLGAMLVILVIDLQMKRSIARQAVTAAERCAAADSICGRVDAMIADLKGRADARQSENASAGDAGHRGGNGPDGVGGTAGVAAEVNDSFGPPESSVMRRAPSTRKRTPRDGGRTGGPGE